MSALDESPGDPRRTVINQWNQAHPENRVTIVDVPGEPDQQHDRMATTPDRAAPTRRTCTWAKAALVNLSRALQDREITLPDSDEAGSSRVEQLRARRHLGDCHAHPVGPR